MDGKERIGVLTGGGDCPGLNSAIRAITKTAIKAGYIVIGIRDGWGGILGEKIDLMLLDSINTSGIIDRGGTILGTSRMSPFQLDDGPPRVINNFAKLGLEALVVLGGDGTLSAAARMHQLKLPIVAIPKTIDNDIRGTEYTIGFQTAVQVATDALDRLRSTAASHHRVMILEVMGRDCGWIATYAGMANGADAILIPEILMDQDKIDELCKLLENRRKKGINFSIVVVAEGIKLSGPLADKYEKPSKIHGMGKIIGEIVAECTGLSVRVSSLGYVQRGGTPCAYDRSLATVFGVKAIELIKKRSYGRLVVLQNNKVKDIPIEEVLGGIRKVDLSVYKIAEKFFG